MNRLLSIFSPTLQTTGILTALAIAIVLGSRSDGSQAGNTKPAAAEALEFAKGERIALVGNSTAERMNLFGHFETLLHLNNIGQELVFRNFARPADEVSNRQRSADYTKIDDPLAAFKPDTFLCFFGFNESFAGPGGIAKFKNDYERFIDEYTGKYPRGDAKKAPRFLLVSPVAFEPTGDPLLPAGSAENANLKLYSLAVEEVAKKRGIPRKKLLKRSRACSSPSMAAISTMPEIVW